MGLLITVFLICFRTIWWQYEILQLRWNKDDSVIVEWIYFFPVHPIIIQFLLVSVVDVRNEYYVLVNFDECYQTLYRCICNVAFMSFILVDRDETGSDPELCPISRILSLFFLGSQNRIQMRWKLIDVPYAYQKSNFKYSDLPRASCPRVAGPRLRSS